MRWYKAISKEAKENVQKNQSCTFPTFERTYFGKNDQKTIYKEREKHAKEPKLSFAKRKNAKEPNQIAIWFG